MMGIQIVFALFFRVIVARLYNAARQSVVIAALFHAALNVANDPPTVAIIGNADVDWLPLPLVAIAAFASILVPVVRRRVTASPVTLQRCGQRRGIEPTDQQPDAKQQFQKNSGATNRP